MDFLKDLVPDRLLIPETLWKKMESDVASRAPQEACGIVAGLHESTSEIFPVTNLLNSSVEFRMDPQEQIEVFERIETQHLALLGIYHSHPGGPPGPSAVDLAQAYYPGAVQLIWFSSTEGWRCQGFAYLASGLRDVRIEIVSE